VGDTLVKIRNKKKSSSDVFKTELNLKEKERMNYQASATYTIYWLKGKREDNHKPKIKTEFEK